ncbi:MAG TPA: hypothetical protein IAC31_02185 [Candidatus Faecousia intestinigallinarum]|nr:hypothetical protein [Candidatus Faecousia intestinigallinarum]
MNIACNIDIASLSIPESIRNAFHRNSTLLNVSFSPELKASTETDGTTALFITAEDKAMLFYEYCTVNSLEGRILCDELHFHSFGDFVICEAKAYVYIGETLKGSAVSVQCFQIGNVTEMDAAAHLARGMAKSAALTNAGFGIISRCQLPPTGNGLPDTSFLPLPTSATQLAAPSLQPQQQGGYFSPAAPSQAQPLQIGGSPDPRAVVCPLNKPDIKGKTMGEVLLCSPKSVIWLAEMKNVTPSILPAHNAAVALYEEACRYAGQAPKQLR